MRQSLEIHAPERVVGVLHEQPGGRRSHLERELVEPLAEGALVLRRSEELFAYL